MTKQEFLSMNLKKKVGQTAIVRVREDNPEMGEEFEKYFKEYGYGGIFMGAEIIKPGNSGRADLRRVSEDLRKRSEIPPVFCGDTEAGFRNVLCDEDSFPDQMALGAANDPELAYRFGYATARESLSSGINWALAPMTDLNLEPLNCIDNVRSLGDDPDKVLPLLSKIVSGMQDNGLAACLKSFPGDGADYRDPHFIKTENPLSKEEWFQCYGDIYRRLFAEGAMSVMIGHTTLPWYQGGDAWDRRPATLSKELLTDFLKGELGFRGLTVSDALEMGGYEQEYRDRERSEIESFKAGMDMLLWPTKNYFRNLEKAVLSGEVPESRLNDALERIWEFKNKLGCFAPDYTELPALEPGEKEKYDALSAEIAERSVTLLRDRCRQIPFSPEKIRRVAIVLESVNEKGYESMSRLKAAFERRGCRVDLIRNGVDENWQARLRTEHVKKYDLAVLAMYLRPHEPLGFLDFANLELVGISKIVNLPFENLVSVSFGSPYAHRLYCEKVPVCVNCYSDVEVSYEAFAAMLFGEIPPCRTSPVKGV